MFRAIIHLHLTTNTYLNIKLTILFSIDFYFSCIHYSVVILDCIEWVCIYGLSNIMMSIALKIQMLWGRWSSKRISFHGLQLFRRSSISAISKQNFTYQNTIPEHWLLLFHFLFLWFFPMFFFFSLLLLLFLPSIINCWRWIFRFSSKYLFFSWSIVCNCFSKVQYWAKKKQHNNKK